MFPLFYVNSKKDSPKTSFVSKPGYMPVFRQGSTFVVQVSDSEFQEVDDPTWVVNTFKNMMFLDQCYWN